MGGKNQDVVHKWAFVPTTGCLDTHTPSSLTLRGRNGKPQRRRVVSPAQTAEQQVQHVAGPHTSSTLEESLEMDSSIILFLFLHFSPRNVFAGDQCPRMQGREAGAQRGRLYGVGVGRQPAQAHVLLSHPFLPQQTPDQEESLGQTQGRASNIVKGMDVGMGKNKRSGQ